MWQGKVRKLTREQLLEEYPNTKLKVLDGNSLSSLSAAAVGWMADVVGWRNDFSTATTWMGGAQGQGPYYVCEFYMVRMVKDTLTLWSDNILRFENDPKPDTAVIKRNEAGAPIQRKQMRRTIMKYVVTALDLIEKTEWPGTLIPFFWVLGPEIWRDGKR